MNVYTPRINRILSTFFTGWINAACLGLALTASADRVSLRLMEDKLWLKADRAPIQEVMEAFTHLGVDVRLDPAIKANIDGELENIDVEKALQEILGPFSYVLQWRRISGPAGQLILLDRMEVFQTGQRNQARPLNKEGLDIIRPNNGPAYVKEELLLALNSKISREEFNLLLARIGGTVIDSVHPPGIYRIRLGANADVPSMVALLEAEGVVHHAEPNYVYDQIGNTASKTGDVDLSLPSMSPPASGQPAVAVLDSGVMSLAGLDSQVIAGLDATQPGAELQDSSGHGTQMALIAAGLIIPDTGQAVDESIPVVAIKAFDENGHSSGYDILNGLAFAAKEGASVINMSWGSEANSDFLHDTLIKARANDMFLVAAAGNEPSGTPVYPAAFPEVLSVGALGADGTRWAQSNFGSFVDVVAPGSALLPVGYKGPAGSYGGTSISSAYTAKTIAAYRQRNPGATADQIQAHFISSLSDLGAPGKDLYYGSGALDNAAITKFLK